MTQLIIVIFIVAVAFGVAGYKIYARFFSPNRSEHVCSGCTGCSLRNELKARQKGCFDHPEQKEKWLKATKDDSRGIADSK